MLDTSFLMFITDNPNFVNNERDCFVDLYRHFVETAKATLEEYKQHNAMAFVILKNGEVYSVDPYYFKTKEEFIQCLKIIAAFDGCYGIITILECWMTKLDNDSKELDEISSGKKLISECDDKEEVVMVTAETVDGFKEATIIPVIRSGDSVIAGTSEMMDTQLSGRFCNLFKMTDEEKMASKAHLN